MSGEYSGREVMSTEGLGWGLVYREQQGGRCGWSVERQADRATVGHLEDSGFILTVNGNHWRLERQAGHSLVHLL